MVGILATAAQPAFYAAAPAHLLPCWVVEGSLEQLWRQGSQPGSKGRGRVNRQSITQPGEPNNTWGSDTHPHINEDLLLLVTQDRAML
jgi:hypothetical protein